MVGKFGLSQIQGSDQRSIWRSLGLEYPLGYYLELTKMKRRKMKRWG